MLAPFLNAVRLDEAHSAAYLDFWLAAIAADVRATGIEWTAYLSRSGELP
jgi:hypothetical protein